MIKNLNRLWTSPQFTQMGFTKSNTIIIDDNYYNSALNRTNEIISPPYQVPIGELDYDYFCVALLMMLDKKYYGELPISNIPLIYSRWQKLQEKK